MDDIGPIDFLVVAFPGEDRARWAATAVRKVEVNGDVRVVDTLLVVKAVDGDIRLEELSDVATLASAADDYQLTDLSLDLIGVEDAYRVAEWARRTAEAVCGAGGRLVGSVQVPYQHVADAMADRAPRRGRVFASRRRCRPG